MIELVNVEKTYYSKAGDIHALHKTSLSIKAGEIFGIIGLSGAGKSTLVRCINMLEKPTAGQVFVDGQELTAMSEAQRAFFNDVAAFDNSNAVTDGFYNLHLVCNQHDGKIHLFVDVLQQMQNRFGSLRVEGAGCFVAQKYLRIACQGAGNAKEFTKSVINAELPDIVKQMKLSDTYTEGSKLLVRISFIGDSASEPIISGMVKHFDVDVSIISGNTDQLKDVLFGTLLIEISGNRERIKNALEYLHQQHLKTEVIGYES